MKFSEIKTSVKTVLETGYVPFIRGLHGIGKSEMIREIANEIANENDCEVSLHCVDMSHIIEGELTGMPITGKDRCVGAAMEFSSWRYANNDRGSCRHGTKINGALYR